ncbi:PQQ-binding-like beta-propeller repeat protein [Streptomyces sp. NPDC051366]|uniref:outer membrane protein assembly factor BamB family protein n=1 Tax=Streptomyces sp. NPDC051366 TaxID=3365652 RepID=UPI0037BCAE4E
MPRLSSPAVVDGAVYVNSDGSAYALDAATGTRKWARATSRGTGPSPAVANGVVYVGNFECLYALDAATGGPVQCLVGGIAAACAVTLTSAAYTSPFRLSRAASAPNAPCRVLKPHSVRGEGLCAFDDRPLPNGE